MIIRAAKSERYTTICNDALNDPNLSLKAKGLWAFVMTKPNNWKVTSRGLAAQIKEGRDAVLSALQELEVAGYFKKGESIRGNDGKWVKGDSTMYETPWSENPDTVNPTPENPDVLVNTNKVNTDKESSTKVAEPLFNSLVETLGYQVSRVKFTPGRKQKLAARMKSFTEDEIRAAAKSLAASPWHMGDNPNNVKYATIDFLLRNDEMVEKWSQHKSVNNPKRKVTTI